MTFIRFGSGFTLVELLVVVAIIGILMAVLIPMLVVSTGDALNVKASKLIETIGTKLHLYKGDHGVFPDSEISYPWSTSILVGAITKKTSSNYPYMEFREDELTGNNELKNPAVAGDVLKYRNNKMEGLTDDPEVPVKNKDSFDIWCKNYSGVKTGINNWK